MAQILTYRDRDGTKVVINCGALGGPIGELEAQYEGEYASFVMLTPCGAYVVATMHHNGRMFDAVRTWADRDCAHCYARSMAGVRFQLVDAA